MLPNVAGRERAWIDAQKIEDSADYVVSFNFEFERHYNILNERVRADFVEAMEAITSETRTGLQPLASELYRVAISRNRDFWTAGEAVSPAQPLVMVKHGLVLYHEKWSFFSGLPEDPSEPTLRSSLEASPGPKKPASPEYSALRRGGAVNAVFWDNLAGPLLRDRINQDLIAKGFDSLLPEQSGDWDSYARYHDGMVADGYIPIWWVTTAAVLATEIDAIESEKTNEMAQIIATALGLSSARLGPYYVAEIPRAGSGGHRLHKPTILCGGFADNFCATLPASKPGTTARLATGEPGLMEVVMVPIDPARSVWDVVHPLGAIDQQLPPANTQRLRERLEIK